MTDPALIKSWNTNLENVHIAADGTQVNGTNDGTNDRKTLLLTIVNGWLGATGSGITVTRSCDAVSAADSNLWTDITKLRWNNDFANAHSWIAFQHTTLWSGGTTYFLLSLVNLTGNDGSMLEMWVSVDSAFTGGSATARPTATNEQLVKSAFFTSGNKQGWWGSGTNTNAARDYVVSQVTSTDGQVSRTVIWHNSVCIGWWGLERMRTPQGLTYDFLFTNVGFQSDTEIAPEADNVWALGNYSVGLMNDKSTATYKWTMHAAVNTRANQRFTTKREDGSVGAFPIGVWSDDPTFVFKWGDLFDMYWGVNDAVTVTHLPNDAQRDFVKVYDFAFPWSSSPIMEIA